MNLSLLHETTPIKERRSLRADYLAQTLSDLSQCLEDLQNMVDSAEVVADVFPLWSDTRGLENTLTNIRFAAARKVDQFMEQH